MKTLTNKEKEFARAFLVVFLIITIMLAGIGFGRYLNQPGGTFIGLACSTAFISVWVLVVHVIRFLKGKYKDDEEDNAGS